MVRIRMARHGRPHRPFYRINAVDARVKRNGSVIEELGWYDPMTSDATKKLQLHEERIKYWLSKGAQPSDTVRDFLAKAKLVDEASWTADRAAEVEAKKARAAKLAAAGAEKKPEAKA